jgi:hypothetical protein
VARQRIKLGDSHNFGRRVSIEGGRVQKPRTLFWEWLLLGRDSPLRALFRTLGERDGFGHDAFDFLPDLEFFAADAHGGGEVSALVLDPLVDLSPSARRALARIAGRSLALFGWLGVADLHWENLVVGRAGATRIVFSPLDVEMILGELELPTETKLLPDPDPEYADICRHACGVRRVLPFLGKPVDPADLVAMAGAYRATLRFLERHAKVIAGAIVAVPGLREAPIRVCLRGTGDYVNALAGSGISAEKPWPPLLDAEREQLRRGDIPYFFRLYGRPGIHYYRDEALRELATLPTEGDVPQQDRMLSLSRGLRSPSRKKLREEGLFTVIGAFDHPSFRGRYEDEELSVSFASRKLVVELPNSEVLETARDLRAWVGSVYLPCRCGEVTSVFVPPVTTCEAAAR